LDPPVKVEIWSDVVCPWCYIGKRRFEAALSRFEHRDQVDVVWRSFELDPSAPAVREGDYRSRLARKYGLGAEGVQRIVERMTNAGAQEELALAFDILRAGNTFDAHRLLHLAAERDVQTVVKERFLAATFAEGRPIGDRDTLLALAVEAGLDGEEVQAVLDGDRYADEVRADEARAEEIGVTGVPFFLIDGRFAVAGAQAEDVFLDVLTRAYAKLSST
jgi:predicted DsbA family dithiol-disulfide isomerase